MRWLWLFLMAHPAAADSLIATRMIAPGAVIEPADITLADAAIPGALTTLQAALGQTARVAIYPGRPLRQGDLGPVVLVRRNQTVALRYSVGALAIMAEGRALGQGGAGDTIRAMNTGSKTTLTGMIQLDGTIDVKGAPCVGC